MDDNSKRFCIEVYDTEPGTELKRYLYDKIVNYDFSVMS